jgi:hypothetical protein
VVRNLKDERYKQSKRSSAGGWLLRLRLLLTAPAAIGITLRMQVPR